MRARITLNLKADVKHFVFISAINAELMRETIQVAEARERVGDAMRNSGLTSTLLRPTGFFNDLEQFFKMVSGRGRAWLIGDGSARSNPIHGADLADIVVKSIANPRWHNQAVSVGGPDIYSMREIAEMIFDSLDKPVKISTIPHGLARIVADFIKIFHPPAGDFLSFFTYEMLHDGIGEPHGSHYIRDLFKNLAKECPKKETANLEP